MAHCQYYVARCSLFYLTNILQQRKVAHNGLNAKKTADYAPYLEVENKQLLFDIMQDSTSILPTFRRSTASMMASIVFG